MNSLTLQLQLFANMKMYNFSLDKVQGKDYAGFLARQSDSVLVRTMPFASWLNYFTVLK